MPKRKIDSGRNFAMDAVFPDDGDISLVYSDGVSLKTTQQQEGEFQSKTTILSGMISEEQKKKWRKLVLSEYGKKSFSI